jgi:hypothetical protein
VKATHNEAGNLKTSRVKWVAAALVALAVLLAWGIYSFAVYDNCLDQIDYDRARKHLCDADPTKRYPRIPE